MTEARVGAGLMDFSKRRGTGTRQARLRLGPLEGVLRALVGTSPGTAAVAAGAMTMACDDDDSGVCSGGSSNKLCSDGNGNSGGNGNSSGDGNSGGSGRGRSATGGVATAAADAAIVTLQHQHQQALVGVKATVAVAPHPACAGCCGRAGLNSEPS